MLGSDNPLTPEKSNAPFWVHERIYIDSCTKVGTTDLSTVPDLYQCFDPPNFQISYYVISIYCDLAVMSLIYRTLVIKFPKFPKP